MYPAPEETRLADGFHRWDIAATYTPPPVREWQRGSLGLHWKEECPRCERETKGRYYSHEDAPVYWLARVCAECGLQIWIAQIVWRPLLLQPYENDRTESPNSQKQHLT